MNTKTTKRRFTSFFMVLTMIVSLFSGIIFAPVTAYAATTSSGDFGENNSLHWKLSGDYVYTLTISGSGDMPDESYDDYPWMKENDGETQGSITTVVIEDDVTSIGKNAFYNYQSLTNVTLGSGITKIGDGAFGSCAKLTSVTIPKSVESIGMTAFYNCSNLTTVTFVRPTEEQQLSIGYYAFPDKASLKYSGEGSITLYDGTTEITENTLLSSVNGKNNLTWKNPTYSITIDSNIENGTVEADKTSAAAGEKVTLTVSPADNYKIDSVSYNDGSDHVITPSEGVYSFTMPASDVTVSATFKEKPVISYTVTFKVVKGSWDDETTDNKTVTLTGYEGDTLKLKATDIPEVGNKPNDTFKAGSWDVPPSTETAITGNKTYTYNYAQKDSISATVTFKVVNGSWNEGEGDNAKADKTVTLNGYEGDTLKLTAEQIPAVGTKPNDTYKTGSWDVTPSTERAITEATTYTYTYAEKEAAVVTKVPEEKTLTYNGQPQELVKVGSATGGTMKYAVTTVEKEPDAEAYIFDNTSIPTGTDAGTYYVWYKVVGDENHVDTEPEVLKVTIDVAKGEAKIETEVQTDKKSPKLEASNLTKDVAESTLTDKEKEIIDEAVNSGKNVDVDVYLAIRDIADEITAEDKAKLEAEASDAGQLAYFDISLFKEIIVDGSSQGATSIHELATPLKLTIGVPKSFPAVADGYSRSYEVLRLHDGVVTVLPATVNADGTISFETDRLSTYAVTYTDSAVDEDKDEDKDKDKDKDEVETVDMYRIYNPNSGEHFYTANVAEKDKLVKLGWKYEGIGWKAPVKSNTPVYRLYNKNAGDHHYTLSIKERDNLVSLGWIYEGIGWYSDDAETVPLYRQYNPNAKAGNHNYTASKSENDWLVGLGWRYEGIGWYGVK